MLFRLCFSFANRPDADSNHKFTLKRHLFRKRFSNYGLMTAKLVICGKIGYFGVK